MALNLVVGQVAAALLLPVYLDTIGTILVAALVGPRAAIVAGLTSQVLNAVLSGNFTWLPFGVVQIVIAVYAAARGAAGRVPAPGHGRAGGLRPRPHRGRPAPRPSPTSSSAA